MGKCLIVTKNYEVFLLKKTDNPYCLFEIGYLRERTFQEIGEGTNKFIDLDEYDEYYHHLVLWGKLDKQIIGAYRLGLGNDIFKTYGINGFYLNSLFEFKPEMHKRMSQSIEMGRAFVIKEYQKKTLPLFLLLKGIVLTTQIYPNYKFLIGGVSISDNFTAFSKSHIVAYMKQNHFDDEMALLVQAKNEFKVEKALIKSNPKTINKLEQIIKQKELGELRLPVLLKKYIKQNVKFLAFNIDPLFNNAIDGLMYIKIQDLSLAGLNKKNSPNKI